MEYIAIAKNIKVSPRKVRLVADSIRDLTIPRAVTALMVSRKRGAVSLKKALESAIANAVNNKSAKKDDLKIKTINVTEGIMYKRFHYAGRGRTRPYTKRTSHINVILEDNIKTEMPSMITSKSSDEGQTKVAVPNAQSATKVNEKVKKTKEVKK